MSDKTYLPSLVGEEMIMMRKNFALFFIVVFGIVSCVPKMRHTQDNNTNMFGGECIPPVTELAFPVRQERVSDDTEPRIVQLPSEWEVQISLPEEGSVATLVLIERKSDYEVVWVNIGEKFLLYQTNSKQWSSLSFDRNLGVTIPQIIFQDQDGQIWGMHYVPSTFQGSFPFFLRFSGNGKFEFVSDADKELTTDWRSDEAPLIDKNGNFWLILTNNKQEKMALYSFDPHTGKAKSHIVGKEHEFGGSTVMAQDGSIFLSRPKEKELVQYFPNKETFRTIELNEVIEGKLTEYGYPTLFFDRSGHLWMDDFGWLDLTTEYYPVWHQIVRSPIFIIKDLSPFYTYVWSRPHPVYESSGDEILFINGGGLTWLNPNDGTWCKFTTVDTNVLEDGQGNLWLLFNNDLYKYKPTP